MNRRVALVLLAVALALFCVSVDAEAQSYVAPGGVPAQTAPGFDGR